MFQNIKALLGRRLKAVDGEIGRIKDFYFDNQSWSVRYVVADTGVWLPGRQVILSPYAFGPSPFARMIVDSETLSVNLSKKQIEESPAIAVGRSITRQDEEDFHRHFGWPFYLRGESMWEVVGFPGTDPFVRVETVETTVQALHTEHHLVSMTKLLGFPLKTTDGLIGKLSSFLIDRDTWAVREMEIETGHWYSGKTILLLPSNVTKIDEIGSLLHVNLTKRDIQETTRNDVAQAGAIRV